MRNAQTKYMLQPQVEPGKLVGWLHKKLTSQPSYNRRFHLSCPDATMHTIIHAITHTHRSLTATAMIEAVAP